MKPPVAKDRAEPGRGRAGAVDATRAEVNESAETGPTQRLQAVLGNRRTRELMRIANGSLDGERMNIPDRSSLERAFGASFSRVNAFSGPRSRFSDALGASAFSFGDQIVFRDQNPHPLTVAHELAHTLQTRGGPAGGRIEGDSAAGAEREARDMAQAAVTGAAMPRFTRGQSANVIRRDSAGTIDIDLLATRKTGTKGDELRTPQGGAIHGQGEGIDLTIIVKDRSGYTADVKNYVERSLQEPTKQVEDIDGIFAELQKVRDRKERIRRLRVVTHGWGDTGDVAVSPRHVGERRFSPRDVAAYARKHGLDLVHAVMAPNAVVEFWGCSIGQSPAANKAWAYLFQSDFTSAQGKFKNIYVTWPPNSRHYYKSVAEVERQLPRERRNSFSSSKRSPYASCAHMRLLRSVAKSSTSCSPCSTSPRGESRVLGSRIRIRRRSSSPDNKGGKSCGSRTSRSSETR